MEPKFQMGDMVRISKHKRKTFDKCYITNWTAEVFIIDKIGYTNSITYKIKDQTVQQIKGSF